MSDYKIGLNELATEVAWTVLPFVDEAVACAEEKGKHLTTQQAILAAAFVVASAIEAHGLRVTGHIAELE